VLADDAFSSIEPADDMCLIAEGCREHQQSVIGVSCEMVQKGDRFFEFPTTIAVGNEMCLVDHKHSKLLKECGWAAA
jgi:hypothetical protein